MTKRLGRIGLIINLKALFVTLAAVLSTYLCKRYGLAANLPLTLVATAVIFPIVFSISGAYKRRENALQHYGALKANAKAIFFAVRDWLENPSDELVERTKVILGDLLGACRHLFEGPTEDLEKNEEAVYGQFSRLSRFIRDDLRRNGLASGEVSRCNQFLSKMMIAFETTKHVYQYRTPKTLRAFSDFFIVVLPVAYGPYFAHMASESFSALSYVMPVLMSVILVSLDNIQDHLENPFDQIGEDDVKINVEKFVNRLGL